MVANIIHSLGGCSYHEALLNAVLSQLAQLRVVGGVKRRGVAGVLVVLPVLWGNNNKRMDR